MVYKKIFQRINRFKTSVVVLSAQMFSCACDKILYFIQTSFWFAKKATKHLQNSKSVYLEEWGSSTYPHLVRED